MKYILDHAWGARGYPRVFVPAPSDVHGREASNRDTTSARALYVQLAITPVSLSWFPGSRAMSSKGLGPRLLLEIQDANLLKLVMLMMQPLVGTDFRIGDPHRRSLVYRVFRRS